MTPAEYLASVFSELTTNHLIASFDIVEQWRRSKIEVADQR